jgi:ABC-2 type transport system permease protein
MSSEQIFFRSTFSLWKREILRFVRQRSRLIGALATPLLFWVLIGGGFGDSFQASKNVAGAGDYFSFFFPGAIALSVLFTAIFSTISVIEDRHQGFLQGVLVSPVHRGALVLSKMLGGASMGLLQGLLLLCLAPLVGIKLSLLVVLEVSILLFLMSACLTGLGFLFAWKIDSVQGYHSMMNMVLMPMWLLSGAVFPLDTSNKIFQWLSVLNPMAYGVDALRETLWTANESAVHVGALPLAVLVLLLGSTFFYMIGLKQLKK